MFRNKSRKKESQSGGILGDAKSRRTDGPGPLFWPFKRAWWAIEKVVIWPARNLAVRIGRLVRRVAAEIAWPFRRAWWAIEKTVIWPVSDRLRRKQPREPKTRKAGPLAWVGATALVMLTAGAVTTAYYFYKEAEKTPDTEIIMNAEPSTESAFAPQGATVDVEDSTAALQGAPPSFGTTSKKKSRPGRAGATVEPSEPPKDPALKVAHRFANSFVSYEVGESRPDVLQKTSTPRLARELASRPPRQPSGGKVPKARVLNVVKGEKDGRRLDVSVALQRSGAATELRLTMVKTGDRDWKVSEVLG